MAGLNGHSHNLPLKNHLLCCAFCKNHIPWDGMRGNRPSHVKSSQSRVLCFGAWKMSSSARLLARGLSVTVMELDPISPYFFETSCGIAGHFRRAQNSGKIIFRHIIRPWSLSIEPLKTGSTIRIWVSPTPPFQVLPEQIQKALAATKAFADLWCEWWTFGEVKL